MSIRRHGVLGAGGPETTDSDNCMGTIGSGMAETYRDTGVREAASESGFVWYISCFLRCHGVALEERRAEPALRMECQRLALTESWTVFILRLLRNGGRCPPYDRRAIDGHRSPTLAVGRMGYPATRRGLPGRRLDRRTGLRCKSAEGDRRFSGSRGSSDGSSSRALAGVGMGYPFYRSMKTLLTKQWHTAGLVTLTLAPIPSRKRGT